MSSLHVSQAQFDDAFDAMVNACGVNPQFKAAQRKAWYERWRHYPEEVIRRGFNYAVQNTKRDFPTFPEVNEALRRAAFVFRQEEEQGYGGDCRICGGSGLLSLSKVEGGYVPVYRSMKSGRLYIFRCACSKGETFSHSIPSFYSNLLREGEEEPRISGIPDRMTRDEVRDIMKSLVIQEQVPIRTAPRKVDSGDCPF